MTHAKQRKVRMSNEEMVTYDGAARIVGVKKPTLYSMVSKKQIPHYRLGRRLVAFSVAELRSWLEQRRVASRGGEK